MAKEFGKRPVKLIKSDYWNDPENHPNGGGTCDACGTEIEGGDGYESDFDSCREIVDNAIYERITGNPFKPNIYGFAEWLDMNDDELFDVESDIINEAFGDNGFLCNKCAHKSIRDAAFAWVEDNYKVDPIQNSRKMKHIKSCSCGKCKSTRKVVKSSVDWGEYDTPEADAINEKYLPAEGEGDTKATQAVTAVNKLIYQWYNNGEVYDNRGGFGSTVNDCDTYANWLANHIDGTDDILEDGAISSTEGGYENALKQLFDFVFDESLLEQLNMEPKEDSIYENNDDYDNMFSIDHETCSECGEDVTDDSSAIDPEQGDGELDNMVWKELARNSDFEDIITYSYGFYEPDDEHNDLYDLYNDWYQEWFRNRDNTILCRDCAERAAEEAAEYISDHYDWEDDEGYDKRTGLDEEGYNREGYDEEGFNREGIDDEGYDREGYNASGRNREGYDREGYDEQGLDERGLGKDRKMGSDKALKHFLGVDKDEDIDHDYDYYRRRR